MPVVELKPEGSWYEDFTPGVDKIDLSEFGIPYESLVFDLSHQGYGSFWYDADFDGQYPNSMWW